MKQIIKILLSVVIILTLVCSVFTFTVSAASVTVSGGNYNVGQAFNVSIKYNAGTPVFSVTATVKYNTSVLKLTGVSGVSASDYTDKNGTLTIADTGFSASGSNNSSYTLSFTAIAEGTSDISVMADGGDINYNSHSASASTRITITKPAPSSNANLASLKVSGASLSPTFSAKTTSYTATVKYDVDKVSISASPDDKNATCRGSGTYDLSVGENTFTIDVTAPSGAKKSYTVVIKRLTEEETAALIEQERAADPTLVVIDGIDYHIKTDLTDITIPEGFTATTTVYKQGEVAAITDNATKYTLCYITADDESKADWYYIDDSGEFQPLIYISITNKMYILDDTEPDFAIPQSYTETVYEAANGSVKAYQSIHSELADFYILSCYIDGETAFYRYDSVQNTIQRAPDFELVSTLEAAAKAEQNKSIFTRFAAMNTTGKIIIILIIAAAIVILVLAVLLIIKLVNRPEKPMEFIPEDTEQVEAQPNPFDIFSITENGEVEQPESEDAEMPETEEEPKPEESADEEDDF